MRFPGRCPPPDTVTVRYIVVVKERDRIATKLASNDIDAGLFVGAGRTSQLVEEPVLMSVVRTLFGLESQLEFLRFRRQRLASLFLLCLTCRIHDHQYDEAEHQHEHANYRKYYSTYNFAAGIFHACQTNMVYLTLM